MHYLHNTVIFEPLIPVIIGFFNYQRLRDKLSKPFLLYLILLSILEIVCLYLSFQSKSNHFFYNLIDLITIIFFTYIFWIERNKILVLVLGLVFIFSLLNFLFKDPFFFNEMNYSLIHISVGFTSLFYISMSVTSKNSLSFDSFRFWFFSGFLISSLTTINLYIFLPRIILLDPSHVLVQYYSFFNFIASTLQYLCFSIAFLCKK
jgi:hypothetical protein